jgi:predicted DCC family thiol-disulfide oxidoreductase YuxK
MNTTRNDALSSQHRVFFDASCRLCSGAADRWQALLARYGFEVLPLQGEVARRELGLDGRLPDEMKVISERGITGGSEALIEIARHIWWARPLALLGSIFFVRSMLQRAYGVLARRRHCLGNACLLTNRERSNSWGGWIFLIAMPLAVLPLRNHCPDWVFMWSFSVALFLGCKWLTWWRERGRRNPTLLRSLAYLLGWVGMDASQFLNPTTPVSKPTAHEWCEALAKTAFGCALLWGCSGFWSVDAVGVRGWCGLVGLAFVLHFGVFHLLALAWRAAGVDAQPIMRAPLLATSLAEFWSRRWNLAFHQLAEREVFKPLRRKLSPSLALLITFAVSGIIHDLVISFPARGGYGLPTCYFVLQGCGVLLERSNTGRRWGLTGSWRGRGFAWLITLAPIGLLFHSPFLARVILPFLKTMGAL